VRTLLLAGTFCVAAGVAATAQERERCTFSSGHPQASIKTPGGQYNTFTGGGVHVQCPKSDLVLTSDSLESYGDDGKVYLVGDVHYNEPRLALTSAELTYYQRDERALARGNVDAKLPNGSTLKGPWAEYWRATPSRPLARINATNRPTITIVQKDSTGQVSPPTTVIGNTVTMIGDSLVYAGGTVTVSREDVTAYGDSMDLDSGKEIVVMMRNPRIEGKKDKPYQLSGNRIEMTSKNRKLERVLAKGQARATSEDMALFSDTIELRVARDLLQRAIAWGPGRARANSATQRLLSDSIDVDMPEQRLREMHAVRGALAEGKPDTTRFRPDTLDWMRGDTIVARFDAPRETSKSSKLREIVALGHARSYHQLAASDTTLRIPAINYVVGREIVVSMKEQKVSKVTVIEKASGVYVEPKAAPAAPPPTTTPKPRPPRS
jgi:lipopolysaccharide export system protein LptA